MNAIILAAGLGTRLRPITESKAKCMVNVAGKPILQHQIEAYLFAGIEEILVVAGYMGDQVEHFCSKYDKVRVVQNPDFATTNNMYSLGLALDQGDYGRGFVLSNGDCVYDHSIVKELVLCPNSVIAVDAGNYSLEAMKIVVEGDRIVDISKQIEQEEAFGNSIDLYKFTSKTAKEFIATVRSSLESDTNEWTEVALQRALKQGNIEMEALDIAGKDWVEVDDYDDLANADFLFSNWREILLNAEAWFVDLDGTLYLGDERINGAGEFIKALNSRFPYYLYSNNSSKDKQQYVEKLALHGIKSRIENMLLSSDGMIAALKDKMIKKIFVLGTEALSQWMQNEGFELEDSDPECVVVGYDTELTYRKLQISAELINKGVPYYATHPDVVCPTSRGPIPDIGSFIAMLKTTTGVAPTEVFGKPSKAMVESVIRQRGWDPEKVVFIGDRLYTDMKMARSMSASFILVLSGETTREDVEDNEDAPDVIVPSVKSLIKLIRKY